ncbi:MAG: hypothetical protein JO218_08210 [Burkholderiales bacterium]|nr:hypothetical protein [Burkholderiales bacterium]
MAIQLVVVQPFGVHQRGEVIADAQQVAAVLAGDLAGHVVKVVVADSTEAVTPKQKASDE